MITTGIVGITGYTGLELFRLLSSHPNVTVRRVFGRQFVGESISSVFPHLTSALTIDSYSLELARDLDVVFLCLPHGEGQLLTKELVAAGKRVIDLSADFRLKNLNLFKAAYHGEHQVPELVSQAVYGLPELFADQIASAPLVANPGCYATSVIVPLYPLQVVLPASAMVVVDAKSGVSGAGRGLKLGAMYTEVNDHFSAYNTFTHRHQVEIESIVNRSISFSTHLVPMSRGILSSIYVVNSGVTADTVRDALQRFYAGSSFISVLDQWDAPTTRDVTGTNRVVMTVKQDPNQDCLVIFCVLDNLIKGASGQAVQNLNVMFGFAMETGLPVNGWFI